MPSATRPSSNRPIDVIGLAACASAPAADRALLAATLPVDESGKAQLLPHGRFSARDGRPGPGRQWSVDDQRGRQLAAEMAAIAAATEIVVDYDHQTLYVSQHGQPAPAAGWIHSAEWRDGVGLFADVRWTDTAKARIQAREYRYISPVIAFDKASGEIVAVELAALVNFPALLGMDAARLSGALNPVTTPESEPMNPILKALLAALQLSESATEQEVLAALQAMQARAAAPVIPAALAGALGVAADAAEPAALAAVQALRQPRTEDIQAITQLQQRIVTLEAAALQGQLTQIIDDGIASGRILPAMRTWAENLGKANLSALQEFLRTAPVVSLQGQSGGRSPDGHAHGALSAADEVMRKQFGLTPDQYAKGKTATRD